MVATALRGQAACVVVEDNGPGIDPDIATRLFEPMVTSKMHGLGLGLALARQIVDAHGGRIWWEPVHPTGTRFVVQLS